MARKTLAALPISVDRFQSVVSALGLAPQQSRIVELIMRNCGDKEIASEMQLGVSTVRTYLGRTFARVGVENRLELVLKVMAILEKKSAEKGRSRR